MSVSNHLAFRDGDRDERGLCNPDKSMGGPSPHIRNRSFRAGSVRGNPDRAWCH